MSLFSPLVLNNGATIPNRIAKAAMEENMADADHAPSAGLLRLYKAWAEGETGLIITGNVMVDARAMTGPGGVVLEDDRHLDRFQAWAEAGRTRGARYLDADQPSGPADAGRAWAGNAGPFRNCP